jgi:gamma-glutamylcyclotransferase (GGCT)/AIG2-like uncharacterized protein YtfP
MKRSYDVVSLIIKTSFQKTLKQSKSVFFFSNKLVMTNYLFVYGTLRKNANSCAKWLLMNNSEYLGEGKIKAKLYRVSWYPAAVAFSEGDDENAVVIGDVFRLNTPDETLKRLDEYEDVPVLYERTIVKVRMNSGACLDAWVYFYKQSVKTLSEIKSGDFLNP